MRRIQVVSKKRSPYKQGYYTPKHIEKYNGKYPIIFRSNWELVFIKWLDENPAIRKWASETLIIYYWNALKRKKCRYYPDFSFETSEGRKFIVEIKPFKETHAPQLNKFKKDKSKLYARNTWITNQSKWESARQWCGEHDHEFKIITEKELFVKKKKRLK